MSQLNEPDRHSQDAVRRLLADAVSDIHPDPALHRIRARAEHAERPRAGGRIWITAVAAAAAVAAVVAIGFAVRPFSDHDPAPVASGQDDAPTGTASAMPPESEHALGIYYLGDTPQGAALYREFVRVRSADSPDALGLAALRQALGTPQDPDYRSPWPAGTRVQSVHGSGVDQPAVVSLANDQADLAEAPAGMSAREAQEAVQQLVYTLQGALQSRPPVRFQIDGHDAETLLGVGVSEPVGNADQLSTLALVSITDPAEGAVVRDSFTASGVASSFEANVPWQLKQGDRVVTEGYSTAEGWADRLYPWSTDPIDVSGLPPGRYTFVAMTDDPSSGEGKGPQVDTRTIVIRH